MNPLTLRFKLVSLSSILALVLMLQSCGSEVNDVQESIVIQEYHISCDSIAYQNLLKNYKENNYIPIKIAYKGKTVVAKMRVRGDTSRKYPKKSLKIKFDSLQLDEVPKKLNLNAEYEDKTYVRQYLSAKMMQRSGQICYQTTHAKVFLNGSFLGLYLQIENMDKAFLKRNNLSTKGNLYKATKDGACLSIFDDFDAKWEKKTNKKSDHNDLTELIKGINETPDEDFEAFLKTNFEFDELINLMALNMFLSNNSTYYHNYYLYHDLYETGKWKMLPWDMDKTMSYFTWMPYTYHKTSSEWESDNPLVERSILCPPVFEKIKLRIKELHEEQLNNRNISPLVHHLIEALTPIIPQDTLDQIKGVESWKKQTNLEKEYFDNHYDLLQQQFNEQPHSFAVQRFKQVQTEAVTFKWEKSYSPNNKPISYIISYGTDFLLSDSSKTTYVTHITDTFFNMKSLLPEGNYYWKVTAFDGEFYTDGFNTKNVFEVKRATPLPQNINANLTLTKAKSPYAANIKTIVKNGATLTIEKGVEIHFPQDATMECNGNFIANGTASEPVVLMPNNSAQFWDYIYFERPCEKALLKNVHFVEGTINCKAQILSLDSCSMLVKQKDMGQLSGRKVLIYTNKGIVSIKNSHFEGNGHGEGMVLFYSDITTENCYFNNVPDAIEYISTNKGLIKNNYVSNSPDDAIDLNNCNNVIIEGNFLFNNIDKAISIGTEQYGASIENIQIKNNLIIGNKTAIAIKDSSVAHVSNNTIVENYNAVYAYKKREDYSVGGFGYLKNNIFVNNEKLNAYADEYSKIVVKNSIVHNKVLGGKNNLKGDPKFIDPKNNNFGLTDNSPCIGTADNGGDMGAFKSQQHAIKMTEIHVKSAKEKNTGDWIKLINNYNMPIDLSLYKLIIKDDAKTHEFVFPIGTKLDGLAHLYVVQNYGDFRKLKHNLAVGNLPKLTTKQLQITLLNNTGNSVDSFNSPKVLPTKKEITYKAIKNNATAFWEIQNK